MVLESIKSCMPQHISEINLIFPHDVYQLNYGIFANI